MVTAFFKTKFVFKEYLNTFDRNIFRNIFVKFRRSNHYLPIDVSH